MIKQELESLKNKGQLRSIPNIESKSDGKIVIDGNEYINFASNDYLGISTKFDLRREFFKNSDYLMSTASARLLTGSSPEYKALENTVAKIFNKERALIFNTGYQCNLGVISALIGKGDVVFSNNVISPKKANTSSSNGQKGAYSYIDDSAARSIENFFGHSLNILETLTGRGGSPKHKDSGISPIYNLHQRAYSYHYSKKYH